MITMDTIFNIETRTEFDAASLEVFKFQFENNRVYRSFCDLLYVHPSDVNCIQEIPFLPIQFFKSHEILSSKQYTGASPELLRNSLCGHFVTGWGVVDESPFHLFHGDTVNRPTVEKASWLLAGLRSIGALPEITAGSISRIHREDIFHTAQNALRA